MLILAEVLIKKAPTVLIKLLTPKRQRLLNVKLTYNHLPSSHAKKIHIGRHRTKAHVRHQNVYQNVPNGFYK